MTADEMQSEINACKNLLDQTDYKAIKHADGALSDVEYEETRGQRDAWRARINELEALRDALPADASE